MNKHRGSKVLLSLVSLACAAVLATGVFVVNASQPSTPADLREANWEYLDVRDQDASQNDAQGEGAPGEDEPTDSASSAEVIVGEDGSCYASNRVLLAFDGAMDEDSLRAALSNEGVDVQSVSLVSKSLDDNQVLVAVDYAGDEDPQDLGSRLVENQVVASSEPDYVMVPDDVDDAAIMVTEPVLSEDAASSEVSAVPAEQVTVEVDPSKSKSDEVDGDAVLEDDEFVTVDVEPVLADEAGLGLSADIVSPDASVNDSYFSNQWEIVAAKFDAAWDYFTSGGKVVAVVIDTGIDYDHSDLSGNLVSSQYWKNTYSGSTGGAAVDDVKGHGTHVAGIIAARANNGTGTAGVSYNAKILPIKVSFNADGQMYNSDIIEGIDYAVSLKTNGTIPQIRVINMSLGSPSSPSGNFQAAINRAEEAGILVVASAGNDSTYHDPASGTAHYPAAYDNVFAVSALKQSGSTAGVFDDGYSNYGPYVDIAAPGTKVYSTTMGNTWGYKSGTSMATPVTTGAAAIVFAQNMNLSPDDVRWLLQATATDIGASGSDNYSGSGALNAQKAVYNRPIAFCTFSKIADQTYTGSAIKPKVTVKYGDTTLVEGTDYTLTYSNNVNPGKATVTVKGAGRSGGSATLSFNIGQPINVSFSGASFTYDGDPHYLKISGSLPSGVSVWYDNNGQTEAGSYAVDANFSSTNSSYAAVAGKTATLTINRASVSNVTCYVLGDWSYTGKEIKPKPTLWRVINGTRVPLVEGVDYTLSYKNNVAIGTGRVYVNGKGNYSGSAYLEFDICQKLGTWHKDSRGWWYQRADGSYPAYCWETIDGELYLFNSAGYMQTGWVSTNGKWRYLGSDGAVKTGWVKDGSWYYLDPTDTGAMKTGWLKLGSDWRYLSGSGALKTGWLWDGAWYYLDPSNDGIMMTGWTVQGTKYRYFNDYGAMQTGWLYWRGDWRYLNPSNDGIMQTGWLNLGGKWRYFDAYGAMQTGWLTWGGDRYYLNPANDGIMATGWIYDDGYWYYLNSSGVMVRNRWVGDYYLLSDGRMATNRWIDGYYVGSDGKWIPGY